jgi:CheY-like chemotaxis protein
MAGAIELAAVFDRAFGERLLTAERLVLSFPQLFKGLLLETDLAFKTSSRLLVAVARLAPKGYGPETRARLQFWTARAGGLAWALEAMSARERAAFEEQVETCDLKTRGIAPQVLFDALSRIVTEAGAPADRKLLTYPRPTLAMDVGGPGWEGISWAAGTHELFIPGAIAPPVGDDLVLALRLPKADRPVECKAKVAAVRGPGEAGPGAAAGFTLAVQSPPLPVHEALESHALQADGPLAERRRAAPRYPVKAPVRVSASAPEATSSPSPAVEQPARSATARIEYATEQELASDYLENLSQGGAFVRTSSPSPVGTRLSLEMRLPGGIELAAPATVVFSPPHGMGVKFDLDADGQAKLASAIARISARPRRALVVDDDGLMRRMMTDALQARGFEVLTAQDGEEGLRTLTDELLALDVLITDVRMPGMDGETFIRTIRQAGGELDLTIVVVTGNLEAELEQRVTAAGANAVLDKSLGPELLAQAADAALERKRMESEG